MNKLIRNITMLGMAGFFLTSCVRNTLIGDELASSNEIRFDNGYIDNPLNTRTAGNTLLSEHMSTMGVWAWYTTNDDEAKECLFDNQCVSYDNNEHIWSYNPKKYWSKKCSYLFNAYAPHSTDANNQTVTIDLNTRHFKISGITLKGDNTMIGLNQPTPLGHFNEVSDIDWMIDRVGQDIKGAYGNEVAFNMQHILAKLCVIADLAPGESKITLDSLEIGEFISKGDFSQDSDKKNEWKLYTSEPTYTIKSDKNVTITKQPICLVESLIFPQITSEDQKLTVYYTVDNSSHFTAQFNLDEIFGKFLTANNYIITLTMGPQVIKFDGGVSDWDNQEYHRYVKQQ